MMIFKGYNHVIHIRALDRESVPPIGRGSVETLAPCLRIIGYILPLVSAEQNAREQAPDPSGGFESVEFDPPYIGCSERVNRLKEDIVRVAGSDISVLIEGESGTGKEIIARNIHRLSPRAEGPLVNVNCAGIQPSLLRAELFGFRRGSFTGALEDRAGLVESAAGGTLFLDEIGEMPSDLQAAILRVIQEKEVRRVGESTARYTDVRFLFATNRDINEMVSSGSFRTDLFFRICGVRLKAYPLRDRREDILPLFLHFMRSRAREQGLRVPKLSAPASNALISYQWPGNTRELINEVERILTIHRGRELIARSMLSSRIVKDEQPFYDSAELTLPRAVESLEKRMIKKAMSRYGGNRSRSARCLGISRQGLLNKIKRYELGGGPTGDRTK
ncbi:MAG: sigma-54 interaction domain-containing protein [Candidatus Krumholzibacteriota bacterium]